MSRSLTERNIVVTGAAKGIGRAISDMIVELGGNVIAVDLDKAGLSDLADSHRGRILPVVGNVADPGVAELAIDQGVSQHGILHGLVNNAGITRQASIVDMTHDQWQEVVAVHLTGSFHFLQAIGKHFVARRKVQDRAACSIVNISSTAGKRGTGVQINYGAAKAGMLGLTMSAAREWGKLEIRVNSICYGMVETEMLRGIDKATRDLYLTQIPFARAAQPEEAARPACFLLSDAASYITGQHLSVDGGFRMG